MLQCSVDFIKKWIHPRLQDAAHEICRLILACFLELWERLGNSSKKHHWTAKVPKNAQKFMTGERDLCSSETKRKLLFYRGRTNKLVERLVWDIFPLMSYPWTQYSNMFSLLLWEQEFSSAWESPSPVISNQIRYLMGFFISFPWNLFFLTDFYFCLFLFIIDGIIISLLFVCVCVRVHTS